MSTEPAPPPTALPPHLHALLGPLSSSRSVLGLLVLSRSSPLPAPPSTPAECQQQRQGSTIVQADGLAFAGEQGRKYALSVAGMVEAVESCVAHDGTDSLKLLRVRTAKHELIITPDPNYILVVLHDPVQ